jgi:hypothetical protein
MEVGQAHGPVGGKAAIGGHDGSHQGLRLPRRGIGNGLEDRLRIAAGEVDVVGHDGIDAGVLEHRADALGVVLRASVDAEDERVASLAVHLADDQPARRAGVGGERRHAGGVADDADAPAARQGLALEELGGVEELLAAREPEDPGVLQERVDRVVAAQRRRAMRLRLAAAAV